MTRDEFARLVGNTIAHHTFAANLPSITAQGLMPAADLALAAELAPATLALRRDHIRFDVHGRTVQLNHQRPLLKGRHRDFLHGHRLETWAHQLDRRLFFLPHAHAAVEPAFAASLGQEVATIRLAARAFFDAFAPDIWLSPINSGNADRRPAQRGDWLYVRVTEGAEGFRTNRMTRGLVKGRDTVREISIRRPIGAGLLDQLRAD